MVRLDWQRAHPGSMGREVLNPPFKGCRCNSTFFRERRLRGFRGVESSLRPTYSRWRLYHRIIAIRVMDRPGWKMLPGKVDLSEPFVVLRVRRTQRPEFLPRRQPHGDAKLSLHPRAECLRIGPRCANEFLASGRAIGTLPVFTARNASLPISRFQKHPSELAHGHNRADRKPTAVDGDRLEAWRRDVCQMSSDRLCHDALLLRPGKQHVSVAAHTSIDNAAPSLVEGLFCSVGIPFCPRLLPEMDEASSIALVHQTQR